MTEEFEEWFESEAMPLEANWFALDEDGEYRSTYVHHAYLGWEAGREALKREQAEKAATAIHEALEPKKGD